MKRNQPHYKPENIKTMCRRYKVGYKRFKQFYEENKDAVGKYLGRSFTPRQVQLMDELWMAHKGSPIYFDQEDW